MKANLRLPPSILERFLVTEKPFAIFDSDIYTIEKNKFFQTEDFWEFRGDRYNLSKSDSLDRLTLYQLTDAKDDIQDYMSWIINFKYIRKLEKSATEFNQNINYYKSLKEDSINKLISDVFLIFNHKQTSSIDEKFDVDTSIDSFPDIRDLGKGSSIFHEFVPRPGIIANKRTCYLLKERPGDGSVNLRGKQYTLERFMDLDELVGDYLSRLKGEIEHVAISHGSKFKDQIRKIHERIGIIDNEIKRTQKINGTNKMGQVGYERLGGDDYQFFAIVEPFILEKDGLFYTFHEQGREGSKKIRVGSRITIDSEKVSIHNVPQVLDMPYHHPFVHHDGGICYGQVNRWDYLGINFNHQFSNSDPTIAKKIAYLLWEGKSAIVHGIVGSKVGPVHNMHRFTPVAKTQSEAIEYARANGINEKRIYKN